MKDRLSEYVPLRDVPLALAHSVLWFVALWAIDYPIDERLGIIVIGYLALWLARFVVSNLVSLVLERLHQYALRVVDRAGIEMPDEPTVEMSGTARALLGLFALAMVLVILGVSFAAIPPIANYVGLTSLGFYFNLAAWVLLGLSALTLTILFAMVFIVLALVNSMSHNPQIPLYPIERSQGWIRQIAV